MQIEVLIATFIRESKHGADVHSEIFPSSDDAEAAVPRIQADMEYDPEDSSETFNWNFQIVRIDPENYKKVNCRKE